MDSVTRCRRARQGVRHSPRALRERPGDARRAAGGDRAAAGDGAPPAVALEAHGLLRRDDEGRFDLGLELVALGQRRRPSSSRSPSWRVPCSTELRDETGESVQLFVREGDAAAMRVSLQSPHALRWIVPDGALLPLERRIRRPGADGRASAPGGLGGKRRGAGSGSRVGQRAGSRRGRRSSPRQRQRSGRATQPVAGAGSAPTSSLPTAACRRALGLTPERRV